MTVSGDIVMIVLLLTKIGLKLNIPPKNKIFLESSSIVCISAVVRIGKGCTIVAFSACYALNLSFISPTASDNFKSVMLPLPIVTGDWLSSKELLDACIAVVGVGTI